MVNGLLAKNGIIVTGSIEVQNAVTASSFSGDGSALTGIETVSTSSLLTTASVSSNTITFTKGDASTFDVTIDTGSIEGFSTTTGDPDDISFWLPEEGQFISPWSTYGQDEYNPYATFISPDGTKFYYVGEYSNNDEIFQYTLNIPYDITSADESAEVEVVFGGSSAIGGGGIEGNLKGLHIANNPNDSASYGKKFYVVGSSRDEVQEYTASVAWDLSTLSTNATTYINVSSEFPNPAGVRFKPDGSAFFLVNNSNSQTTYIKRWDLSTNWDLSTATHNSAYDSDLGITRRCTGLDFNSDGSKLYVVETDTRLIYQFSLSTPYDPSTYSLDKTIEIGDWGMVAYGQRHDYPGGIFIDPNSDYVYITRWHTNKIIRVSRNNFNISNQTTFNKTLRIENGVWIDGLSNFHGGVNTNGSPLTTGAINCAQVNFNSLYQGNQLYSTTGQFHLMHPYLRFTSAYNSAYGIKLIADNATKRTIAVDVTLPTQSGKLKVDTEDYYIGRFNSESISQRTSVGDVEIYYTARADGEGKSEFIISETPIEGQTHVTRSIYHSDKAFANTSTPSDWTELTTFNGNGASFSSTQTELYNQLNNRTVGTVPLSLKSIISNAVTSSLRNSISEDMALAYGLRQLSTIYAGSAIRIINDSDVEIDIGFVNGELDTGSILTHCGSGDGYVTKLYDQSQTGGTGVGNDASHNSSFTSAKPQIVTAGSIITENGKPCMTVDECQFTTDIQRDFWGAFTLQIVMGPNSTSNGMIIGDGSNQDIVWLNNNTQFEIRFQNSRYYFPYSGLSDLRTFGQMLFTLSKNSSNILESTINSTTSTNTTNSTSNHFGINRLFTGWNHLNYDFSGTFQELVVWEKDLSSTQKTEYKSNINSYYNIY